MGFMTKQGRIRSQSHQLWSLVDLWVVLLISSRGLAWLLLDLVFLCLWNYLDQIRYDIPWCLFPVRHYPDGSLLSFLIPSLNQQQEDELTLLRLWVFARWRQRDCKCAVFLNNPNNHIMRSALLSIPMLQMREQKQAACTLE